MKRIWKRILAAVLAVVLICPASLAVLPAREAAAEETMRNIRWIRSISRTTALSP